MKKLLRVLIVFILLIGWWFLLIFKNPQRSLSQKIMTIIGIQESLTPEEQWLSVQTGDIFIPSNLSYIQKLTENSSGKLAKYIKKYIDISRILYSGNDFLCQNNTQNFYIWNDFVCFKNRIINYQDAFWNLWSWNKKDLESFINTFNTILSSVGPLSLSLLTDDTSILEMSIGGKFNADPKTFTILNDHYAKDANKVYLYDIKEDSISQIYLWDPMTFEPLSFNGAYFTAKDKNNVYHLDQIISWINSQSIKLLSWSYAVDTNHVYYYANIISWADPKTFIVIMSGDQLLWKDAYRMYIRSMNFDEYQKEAEMMDSNLMMNNEYDTEVTWEAYRIQNDLPKIPDFIIENIKVNTDNTAKTTDKIVTLHLTIANVWWATISSKKVDYLRLTCSAEIGNWDTYLFNFSKDINNINWWKDLQPNERFTVDIQWTVNYYGLVWSPEQAGCHLYNYYIKETNQSNNWTSLYFTISK